MDGRIIRLLSLKSRWIASLTDRVPDGSLETVVGPNEIPVGVAQ